MPLTIPVTAGSLPPGYCYPPLPQALLNDFAALLSVTFPGTFNIFNFGSTTPTPDNRIYPWYKLNPDGTPAFPVWYNWATAGNGVSGWLARHPVDANDDEERLWKGIAADLPFKDGGNANPVSDTDGPFWEIDADMAGRVPLAPGVLAPSGVTVNVDDAGGVDRVTLTAAQGATKDHTHGFGFNADPAGNNDAFLFFGATQAIPSINSMFMPGDGNASVFQNKVQANLFTTPAIVAGAVNPDLVPVNILNPYRGRYVIKRTSRVWYLG